MPSFITVLLSAMSAISCLLDGKGVSLVANVARIALRIEIISLKAPALVGWVLLFYFGLSLDSYSHII